MVDDSLDIGIGKTGDWRVKLIWVRKACRMGSSAAEGGMGGLRLEYGY
jgi:hypothetical protein